MANCNKITEYAVDLVKCILCGCGFCFLWFVWALTICASIVLTSACVDTRKCV